MSILKPFRGLRFDQRRLGRLEPALVISERREGQSAASLGHLPDVHAERLVHPVSTAAETAALLGSWIEEGILTKDPIPAIYPYRQRFSVFGKAEPEEIIGVIALLRADATAVKLHEDILPQNVRARVPFLKTLGLQTLPTHGLYVDSANWSEDVLREHFGYPLLDLVDGNGVQHSLGRITDASVIAGMQRLVEHQSVYLADGHHRWATHRQVMQELPQSAHTHNAVHPAGYHLMFLSNAHSPGLHIFPTHRIVRMPDDFDRHKFWEGLARYYAARPASARRPATEDLVDSDAQMGLVFEGQMWLLYPKEEAISAAMNDSALPAAVRPLSYTILHFLILDGLLGFPMALQGSEPRIHYTKQTSEAIKASTADSGVMSFMMRELSVEAMMHVCDAGAKMPQKSTHFYPKVLGGMVFADLIQDA